MIAPLITMTQRRTLWRYLICSFLPFFEQNVLPSVLCPRWAVCPSWSRTAARRALPTNAHDYQAQRPGWRSLGWHSHSGGH